MVVIGGEPAAELLSMIELLLPLLGPKLVEERAALAASGHALAAKEASQRAGALNEALDVWRYALQVAYSAPSENWFSAVSQKIN